MGWGGATSPTCASAEPVAWRRADRTPEPGGRWAAGGAYARTVDVTITTVAERPALIPHIWAMPDSWPAFMDHDLVAASLFAPAASAYRELGVVATAPDGSI